MKMQISENAISIIQKLEGFRSKPYLDLGGKPTIGYGHTGGVTMLTNPISEQTATQYLLDDLNFFEEQVNRFVKVPINQNQFDALVLLIFNVGVTPLLKRLGKYLNSGDYNQAAEEFLQWDHVGVKVVQGLLNRRMQERELFNKPVEA